jgi:uncharacterized protein
VRVTTSTPSSTPHSIQQRIADELGARPNQVAAAVDLLDGGATVPFIARYRKEATGALDDTQLRTLEERLRYLRELEERRTAVLEEIRKQGKLDEALETRILAAESKARLEDIYLPFKPKRRTRAMAAREAGLEPLADALLADPSLDPHATAAGYVTDEVADAGAALEGARAILVERMAEDADLIGGLRERMWTRGRLVTKVREGEEQAGAKFADYFDFSEPFTRLPSHRILAAFRGENEDVLDVALEPTADPDDTEAAADYERTIAAAFGVRDEGRPADCLARRRRPLGLAHRGSCCTWASTSGCGCAPSPRRPRSPSSRPTCATCCWPRPPAAGHDGPGPGLRTGVKVAVVDATGKVVATDTVYPHEPRRAWDASLSRCELAAAHDVDLVAIGNGTASGRPSSSPASSPRPTRP